MSKLRPIVKAVQILRQRFPKTSYSSLFLFLTTVLLDPVVSGSTDCKVSMIEKLEVPTDGSKVPNIHHLSEVKLVSLEIRSYFPMYLNIT